jgi:hypothetical protein
MKTDGYWQNFSSQHKIFLSVLTFTLISGYFSGDFFGIFYLCVLATIIYTIIKITNSRVEKQKSSELSQEKMSEEARKTILLFNRPVTGDWLFWVFMVTLASSSLSGLPNILNSSNGFISGVFDILFLVIFAWFPLIPVIYIIRKLVHKRKKP